MGEYRLNEQQRQEIHDALLDRQHILKKTEKGNEAARVETDNIERRLALYDNTDLPDGRGGTRVQPGLLMLFARELTLDHEALAQERDKEKRDRDGVNHDPDLFGGGTEVGGGHKPGETTNVEDWNARMAAQYPTGTEITFDPNEQPPEDPEDIAARARLNKPRLLSAAPVEEAAEEDVLDQMTASASDFMPEDPEASGSESWDQGPDAWRTKQDDAASEL